MRTYAPSAVTLAPEIPLHSLGRGIFERPVLKARHGARVVAPLTALHSLGYLAAGASPYTVAAPIASKAAGAAVSSAIASSSSAGFAAAAGPIGAAVAAGLGIVLGLLAAHEQRMRDAKTENSRVAAAVPSFYQTLEAIVQQYNSGQLAMSDAINAMQQLDATTQQLLHEFVGTPGTAWNSSQPGVCDRSCTVGCCIYNTWLHPDLYGTSNKLGAIPVMQGGGGTLGIGGIPTNKYGFPGYPHSALTINPPSAVQQLQASLTSGVGGLLGSGSLLPILLIGGAALLLMR